jgi:tRNA pseudouridine55 synthase
MPPAYSAKKVGGQRAYALARRNEDVTLAPVPVTVTRADLVDFNGTSARVALTCSAGFYVRRFAHDLGERLGTGACLESLRRTRSGEFGLDRSVDLDALRARAPIVAERWIPLDALLPGLKAVRLDQEGCRRVRHGQDVGPSHGLAEAAGPGGMGEEWVRLLDERGRLLALATSGPAAGSLHPRLVLI